MSCDKANNEDYSVVVELPKSLPTRCGDCCRGIERFYGGSPCIQLFCPIFLLLCVVGSVFSFFGVWLVVSYCQKSPGLRLEDVSIRNMALYQNYNNSTMPSATDTPWEVTSDISVNLSTWNKNSVARCFTTYRRMYVYVDYQGQQIVKQEVPLGFGLKPRRSRPVLLDLKGDHFPVARELGSLLQVELRNASAVGLQFRFDTRYLRNDRKAGWIRMACNVIARTPLNWASNSSGGGILWSSCQAA